MDKVLIVGSGASGVHFALSLLKKGYEVTMLDVGYSSPEAPEPESDFNQLKTRLDDPASYFLGEDFSSVVTPLAHHEYYGFPPSKAHIFRHPEGFEFGAQGFNPLFSFARGGLAEAWTGGVYPLNEEELEDFPIPRGELARYYGEVSRRIGIAGAEDDLTRFYPMHEDLLEPLELDPHSSQLLRRYARRRDYMNRTLRCYLGRSRVAALSVDRRDRGACTYTGRCLWGCPVRAFYTPSLTLQECRSYPNFSYLSGAYVSHFVYDSSRRIKSVALARADGQATPEKIPTDRLVLAAGTLSSSSIYLRSLFYQTGETAILGGIMDNRQILLPFLNLGRVGEVNHPQSYQYHQLAMGIETADPREYVHGQITTLKTAMVHPIVQNLPMDLRTSIILFRLLRAGLGVINLNLRDTRRTENHVMLDRDGSGLPRLLIRYSPPKGEEQVIRRVLKTAKRALRSLGCLAAPGMTHVRPMGASVHYAGTIPMSEQPGEHTASPEGRSHSFSNLWFVDGTTFPVLPAKNLTFTLMANAVRVADRAF